MNVQLVVASGNRTGQTIPVTVTKFVIGRADDCHLKPRSELISRYHCAIVTEENRLVVRDLGSKNGVFLNGKRVSMEEEAKHGDKLIVGPLEFFIHTSLETKAEKKPKVDSVDDAVVRSAAPQEGDLHEEQISNWLIGADESEERFETQTVDASVLLDELTKSMQTQDKNKAAKRETDKVPADESSKDAASKLIKSFFGMK